MRIKKVLLTNFRNYEHSLTELSAQRNILTGENAQGKTNFLEAIEILAKGSSDRATQETDLVRVGAQDMRIELELENASDSLPQAIALSVKLNGQGRHQTPGKRLEKKFQVNGASYSSFRQARGRLVIVSFKSNDLNLLRGSPKFRRDWIDHLATSLQPTFQEVLSQYQKVVSQRNRLLRTIFEKGKLTTTDSSELKVWDEQTAQLGAQIIKRRLTVLSALLPRTNQYQNFISQDLESLKVVYERKSKDGQDGLERNDCPNIDQEPPLTENNIGANKASPALAIEAELNTNLNLESLKEQLLHDLKTRRHEEIVRKQTLSGPHRDDIVFYLGEFNAAHFASQGQQRSIVLSLKLAELNLVSENLNECPVLLLDDVLAELDLTRQALLLSLVSVGVQTLITATDLSGFQAQWLDGATFFKVERGSISKA